jgi:hypothetical protein
VLLYEIWETVEYWLSFVDLYPLYLVRAAAQEAVRTSGARAAQAQHRQKAKYTQKI